MLHLYEAIEKRSVATFESDVQMISHQLIHLVNPSRRALLSISVRKLLSFGLNEEEYHSSILEREKL